MSLKYTMPSSSSVSVKNEKFFPSTDWDKWKHPFGVQMKRFQNQGIHPGLITAPQNSTTPCDYNPSKAKCVRRSNRNNWQPWRIEDELMKFSKNLGYEHFDLLQYRKFMQGQLGPGSHDINLALFTKQSSQSCPNQNFGREKRFNTKETISPGPARYCLQPTKCKVKHVGPTIGCAKRFEEDKRPWSLPCNLYHVKDYISIDALVRKKISTRGPYDLFTGPRDPSNMFNKIALGKNISPDTFYTWPSSMDQYLHHKRNKMTGKFRKAERFLEKPIGDLGRDLTTCYRDPTWPGPVNYVLGDGIKELPEQKYPFRLSGTDIRPRKKWTIYPGPGRYNVKSVRCNTSVKKRPTSVFASLTVRPEFKAPVYNDF